ncbi:MAG: 3-oxoacyl-[acyl-carrier-protein] reductase [Synergistales bacterium]|jgi:3-oxoacyl-[acyl-carrier protein] reductase|nr:3-oxoacyl-[acyl-carrier-protein] reductase [Synergistales bacterium]
MGETCRVAIVTGAGKGIGRAVALELGRRGMAVAVNYNRSEKEAWEVTEEINSLGRRAFSFQADVSDVASVKDLFEAVNEKLGPVSVLVNNSGITRDGLLLRMKDDDWKSVLDVNLSSVFYCSREALRFMAKARWGRIINVSSVVALCGNVGQANYTAAKAGIIGLTKTIAREFGPRGITANVVAPGFIETDMTNALKEEVRQNLLRQVPLGRPGTPADVASLVGFLASEEAGYVSGQTIAVDGGMSMQ